MRSFTLTAGCLLLALGLFAQQLPDLKYFDALAPRNIGPAGMSGRVTAIDVDLSDSDIIYIGTASGGAWKSVNGGITWQPIFDEQPVGAVGAIAVNQKNPSVVWVGTGEGNPRNSANAGAGIFKSLDGGKTWKSMGLEQTRSIHRIIIHRDNPDIVYAGAQGSMWGPNAERGVFRTRDGGKTWEKILYVNDSTGVADMVVDPSNPEKIIVALWEYGRKPWTFHSGGKGSGIYITLDGGDTWERRTDEDGLPKGDLGRVGLAIARSKPNIVYALVEAKENALFKSTDGGKTWANIATKNIGDRPFYYAEIYVDPKNENRLYNLYSLVSRSEDGGKTFEVILPYSGVHPDHHAFWIHPEDPSYLIDGNDGGLNISRDGGASWRFIPNLPLAQFYHINYDMDVPYNVGGGMQDNGSWVGPSAVWKAGGILNTDWQEVFFGDGFDVAFRPDNNRYVYAMSQGGNLGYIDRETGQGKFVKPVHPDGTELRFNWNAAFAQSPFDPCTIYYGSQFVHKSTDCGQSWEIISPDLTTNDPAKQQQDKSGGLTIDATNAENHTTILAIAPDQRDPGTIWVGTDDGNLQLTRDGGQTWTNLSPRFPNYKAGSWIPYIELSQVNQGEAFVVVNDYRRNDWRPMVYHTGNYGQSWTKLVDENKVQGYALSIVQDPLEPRHLWLGTDHGLFFSLNGGQSWTKYNKTFPSVSTIDLKIHPREHDLIIGTFGRAAWILDDLRPFREIAQTGGQVLKQDFALFDAPDAYLHESLSYQGLHFPGDAEYSGRNRPDGALLTVWVKPEGGNGKSEVGSEEAEEAKLEGGRRKSEEKKTARAQAAQGTTAVEDVPRDTAQAQNGEQKAKKEDKVKLVVFNAAGDTIRQFSQKVEPGFNRFTWNLNRNGVRFPSRREMKPEDDPPSGPEVLPGPYKVVAMYNGHKDSTTVNVHADPRLPGTPDIYAQREAMYRDLQGVVEASAEGFERLQNARKSIDLVEKALANVPQADIKGIKDQGKALRDSLSKLEELYMEPEDVKGIQRNPNNLQSTLRMAGRYIGDVTGEPSQMARLTLERARRQTQETLDRINNFLTKEMVAYRQQVEAVQYSLFSELEPVKLN